MCVYNHRNREKKLEREGLICVLNASICTETESNFKLQYVVLRKY